LLYVTSLAGFGPWYYLG